jgi:hypothetical protein
MADKRATVKWHVSVERKRNLHAGDFIVPGFSSLWYSSGTTVHRILLTDLASR